jgi:hypothetical protein
LVTPEEDPMTTKVTQLVLTLESKPGVLGHVCQVLGGAGINIEGLWVSETATGKGRVRLLVADAAKAEAALKAAKIRSAREEAISLSLENQPGALAAAAQKLAQARVNIKCAHATTTGTGPATVILAVSNVQKALAALQG